MKKFAAAFAIFIGLTLQAQAREYHHHHYVHHYIHHTVKHERYHPEQIAYGYGGNVAAARSRGLPWCGAYMADKLGFAGALGRELWVAANWARVGVPTSPHIGAVVVWHHHVGQIVGQEHGEWVVNSGNDGHAVRSRARSLAGAIAIRDVGGGSSFRVANNYISSESKHSRRVRYALRQPSYRPDDGYMDRWQVSQI